VQVRLGTGASGDLAGVDMTIDKLNRKLIPGVNGRLEICRLVAYNN
jgi:hypothetical protein